MINRDSRVEQEVARVMQASDPKDIESAVLTGYSENMLCRMLLSKATGVEFSGFASRIELITHLRNTNLPHALTELMGKYPASIIQEELKLIFD